MQCPDRTTNLTRGLFSSPPEGFFRTTSPAGGFRFIQKRRIFPLDGKTRQYGNFKVFSREYFSPKHYMTGEDCSTNRTIAFHHYASTWHTRRERVKNDCTRIAYRMLGEKRFSYLEKHFNASLERKIRRELP